jgi:ABC-type lipopolysaccharide export system ATPase subunit
MIVGLVRPNSGRVTFEGRDVTDLPMYQRARMGMGYLPQEESIFRKLTVEENIMAILETQSMSRKERKHAARSCSPSSVSSTWRSNSQSRFPAVKSGGLRLLARWSQNRAC